MLVTGGSGYLGDWVVRLARATWDVSATYLTQPPEDKKAPSHRLGGDRVEELPSGRGPGATDAVKPVDAPGVTWHKLDVRDQAAVEALVAAVDPAVILHTAALNPGQGSDFEAVNAAGTRHVARAAASVGARLVHVSTDVLFDGEKGDYVESDSPSPITPYGRSKALAEEAVRASEAEAVIVRTSLIYGWRPTWDRQTRWIVGDLRAGEPVHLFTDERRCPIWVESLAAALIELADLDYTGALHVVGAQALSRYQFGVRLARFHGVDPSGITPALSRESGLTRPLDCTLDSSRARSLLATPLPGVDEVFRNGVK
jgi:dTDP-4-dehydrorhamnose reductase